MKTLTAEKNTAAHTPGPWRIYEPSPENIVAPARIISRDGAIVAHARRFGGSTRDETNTNARLIAAAPELLAALKAVCDHAVEFLQFGHAGGNEALILNEARAAIAKAEGRNS